MTDDADMAAKIEAEHIASGLSRIVAAIPAGVAGVCDQCDEPMPRLVGGRCAFCRDGRRPPASFYRDQPAAPPPPPPPASTPEEVPMTDSCKISFFDDAKEAIRERAAANQIALQQAATELVMAGVTAMHSNPIAELEADLARVHTADLVDEVRRRLDRIGLAADLERDIVAATERAQAAEARLAAVVRAAAGEAA